MTTDTGKPDEPFRRRAENWLFIFGGGIAALGASALFEGAARYWPAPRPLVILAASAGPGVAT